MREIDVDLASFGALREALARELQYSVGPWVSHLIDQYGVDVGLGTRNPSQNVRAFRDRYGDCLDDTVDRLHSYLRESSLLVDAAGAILARYRSVDELAGASVQDITQMLSLAQPIDGPEADLG